MSDAAPEFIVETPYNTRWWGRPFGRITDAGFFDLPADAQVRLLSEFDVVEFADTDSEGRHARRLAAAGFWPGDTQIPFQLNLRGFKAEKRPSYLSSLQLVSAADAPFTLTAEDMPVFAAERFWQLSGIRPEHMAQRYALWSNDLIASDPEMCFQARSAGRVTGWFLGRRIDRSKVELTLAMARSDAGPAGGFIYEAAMYAYAAAGLRLGQAAFSVRNGAVLNIYSRLGARFEAPRDIWLWQKDVT